MRILVLCYEYPPIGGGGGRIAARVAEGLVTRGHEVHVITAGLGSKPSREKINGVDVIRPASFRRKPDTCSVPEMALYLATALLPALRLCREWKPDIIHAHFVVPTGALAWTLHVLTRIPYALTAHLGDVPGGVPEQTAGLFKVVGPFMRPIWGAAAGISAVSSFVADLVRKAGRPDCEIILNGVAPLKEKPILERRARPRILMLGRLSVQKDPLLAVRALALVKDLPWEFEVIGEGPLRAEMQSAARQLGVEPIFSGWLDATEVRSRLANSDILLMPSIHEGLPVAAIEALQHGVAIVGSNIGGLRDVIENGANGFLCDRSPEAFAAKLRGLLENPDMLCRFREASLSKAEAFDLAARVADYEVFLSRCRR